jgi:hypothetical protein
MKCNDPAARSPSTARAKPPRVEFCGHPIGRLWTTNGYLQCDEYVTLDATHPSIAFHSVSLISFPAYSPAVPSGLGCCARPVEKRQQVN